jgi:hypothetical protein
MVSTLLLICLNVAWAKDSASQSRQKLKGFLDSMVQIESQARPVEPMAISLATRTRAQDKEMTRRIELLDNLLNKKAYPLGKEISQYGSQVDESMNLPHSAVKSTYEALADWLNAKLSLQNAGVNNPGLESLRKNEPIRYQEYQTKLKAAQAQLK